MILIIVILIIMYLTERVFMPRFDFARTFGIILWYTWKKTRRYYKIF